jgi:predicted dehydrogenase
MKKNNTDLIKGTAAVAFTVVPRHVLGGAGFTPPGEKLNIACVGTGSGMGKADITSVSTENIVALCDVDERTSAEMFAKFPNVPKYKDFRVMLEKENKNIDAITITIPDHSHAVVAMAAMKMSKHVYCQKPMAHDIYEVRRLTEAAREYKVITQMGIQCHAMEELKLLVEMLRSDVIGPVRQVHLWTDSPRFPQGIDRPTETPAVPAELDWDIWLGPVQNRPYNPCYLPKKWRSWKEFGTGALGDMGCHIFDPAYWALDLTPPISVESYSSTFVRSFGDAPTTFETYPRASMLKYEFEARGNMPPVTIFWYDGGMKPWRPEELEEGRELPAQGGLYIGEKGKILAPHMAGPRLIPESKMKGFKRPEQTLPRGVDHYQDWIRACKGGPKPLANFDYSGPLSEMVLLGNISILTGKKLLWDSPNMKITNLPEANALLRREYRQGWNL